MATIIVLIIGMAVLVFFSCRLKASLEQLMEFWAKRDVNKVIIELVISLAGITRSEAFKARLNGADLPQDFDSRLLVIINKANVLAKRNSVAKDLREAQLIQDQVDLLNDETMECIVLLYNSG